MTKEDVQTKYIGDGVYADFEDYRVRLWTNRQDGVHEIFLERAELELLVQLSRDAGLLT